MTSKRKYIKSGKFTKDAILKRKMERIFGRSKKLYDEAGKRWDQKLENIKKYIDEVKKETTKKGKYVKTGKYIKSGKYTKDVILERKMAKLFIKFNKVTKEVKEEKGWYNDLKKSIMNLFFEQETKFELDKKASGATERYVLDLEKYGLSFYDPLRLLGEVKPLVLEKFKEFLNTKQQLTLQCKMKKMNLKTGEIEIDKPHFHSHQYQVLEGSDFEEIFEKMKDEIMLNFEKWISRGSQWIFDRGLKLILNINKTKVLKGSSYVELPKKLRDKKPIINPKNDDQKCLLWCVGIHEILKENPNLKNPQELPKIIKKKTENFNTKGMDFPCDFSYINKFENNNNNIGINVFGYNKRGSFSSKNKRERI